MTTELHKLNLNEPEHAADIVKRMIEAEPFTYQLNNLYTALTGEYSDATRIATRESVLDAMNPRRELQASSNDYPNLACAISGIYRLVPDIHEVRVSEDNLAQWSYFQTLEHAMAGRRTRTRPARLLGKFQEQLGHLAEEAGMDWHNWTAQVSNEYSLACQPLNVQFATTREECREVYITGPSSCMSYDEWDIHPAEVYAGPDTAVAYAKNEAGHVVARTVVNQSTKEWIRIYGNETGLAAALLREGYTPDGDLDGCRLLLLRDHMGRTMGPYLDSPTVNADIEGGYLVVTSYGEYHLASTSGFIGPSHNCDECGDGVDEEDLYYIENAEASVCEHCLNNYYVMAYIGPYEEYVDIRYTDVYEYGGDFYTEDALERHNLVIDCEGDVRHMDDVILCQASGEYVAYEDSFTCAYNNETYSEEYGTEASDGEMVYTENLDAYEAEITEEA